MKKAYLLFLAAMLSTATFADNKQTVKIDGQVIDKTVREITFDGDNVVLQYSDNTSDQADMSLVTLSFTYQTTGISQVEDALRFLRPLSGFSNVLLASCFPIRHRRER